MLYYNINLSPCIEKVRILSNDLLNMIGNVGFAIAVSVYLLVRLEAKLEVLTVSINNLSNAIKNSLKVHAGHCSCMYFLCI